MAICGATKPYDSLVPPLVCNLPARADGRATDGQLCHCGCGRPAPVAKRSDPRTGVIAGQPVRFISGHNNRQTRDIWARIQARCQWAGECLIWQGSKTESGYGRINVGGRVTRVHRAVYEYFHGPIPDGAEIDHVKALGCHSTACCNVEHLEAVTPRINKLRSDGITARQARQTHCLRGHALTHDNLDPHQAKRGKRSCLACLKERIRTRLHASGRPIRKRVLRTRPAVCEQCGVAASVSKLQVHHLTYAHLGHEHDEDVLLLCVPCHRAADMARRASEGNPHSGPHGVRSHEALPPFVTWSV